MLLGLPFFRKYNIVIHPYKGLLYLPDLTISLASPIKNKKLSKSQILHTVSKTTIHPSQQEIIECELISPDRAYEYTSGLIEPSIQFERKLSTLLSLIIHVSNKRSIRKTYKNSIISSYNKKMKNPPAYDCSLGFCAINEPVLIIATFMC